MRLRGRRYGRLCMATGATLALWLGTVANPTVADASVKTTTPAAGAVQSVWAQRAAASYGALQQYLYLGPASHDMYLEYYPKEAGDNNYSYVWTLTEAEWAALTLTPLRATSQEARNQVRRDLGAMQSYITTSPSLPDAGTNSSAPNPVFESYLPPPLGTSGDVYFDDNTEIGLADIMRYEQTGNEGALAAAADLFDFIEEAWHTSTTEPCPGGMSWVDADWNTIRAANVTGLAAQLAAHLFELTRQRSYLSWSVRLYNWNQSCLQQSPGLYSNDITDTGTIDPTLWIYNSGAMIGTATVLYRATHNRVYLEDALSDAQGAINYWTSENQYFTQPAVFNAIFFGDLLLLDSVQPNPSYIQIIAKYAQEAWNNYRDPTTGLFRLQPSGGGPYDPTARPQTLEQSAMIQIFAMLAWPQQDHRLAA